MAFWEIALKVLELDVTWLSNFIMNNIAFILMLYIAVYTVQKGKKTIIGFLTFSAIILLSRDLSTYFGLAIYTAAGLMFLYLFRLSILTALEHAGHGRFLKPVWFASFFIVIYVYNVFLV